MNWTEEQVKAAERRIQARCKVRKVTHEAPPELPQITSREFVRRLNGKPKPRKSHQSYLEIDLALRIKAAKLPVPFTQYQGIQGRKFKLDFAWPEKKIAVLVQGNVHRIKSKFYTDCELYCLLTIAGWRYLPVSRNEIQSGKVVKWLVELLRS